MKAFAIDISLLPLGEERGKRGLAKTGTTALSPTLSKGSKSTIDNWRCSDGLTL
jgi:hypothetical protein